MSIAEKLTTVAENVPKVYEAGQQAMKTFVENAVTNNFTRSYYAYAFMQQDWSGFTFSKTIYARGGASNVFNGYKGEYLPKNIDLSGANNINRLFYDCAYLLEADCMGVLIDAYTEVFYNCQALKKITGFNVRETSTYNKTFLYCSKLEEIEINGTIGTDISFSTSPLLKVECINDIISHLKDYSGTGTTHTLTLGTTNLAKLSDSEKAVATQKGWTLA